VASCCAGVSDSGVIAVPCGTQKGRAAGADGQCASVLAGLKAPLAEQEGYCTHGTRGNFEKSGFRFSTKAFFPSFASSLM
jgi:hypothetical protein